MIKKFDVLGKSLTFEINKSSKFNMMNLSSLNNTLQSFNKAKKYDNFIDQELL